jgi:hypothetical protein
MARPQPSVAGDGRQKRRIAANTPRTKLLRFNFDKFCRADPERTLPSLGLRLFAGSWQELQRPVSRLFWIILMGEKRCLALILDFQKHNSSAKQILFYNERVVVNSDKTRFSRLRVGRGANNPTVRNRIIMKCYTGLQNWTDSLDLGPD